MSRWRRPGSIRPRRQGIITPFMVLYALHDAMVKPMPGKPLAPCLAESWSAAEDGRLYDFVLRKGAKFHNGDPVTAEDVKFSFERYRGASASVDEGPGGGDRNPRSAARPLQAERAVAGLSDLLRDAPPAPAGSCRRNMSRRSATTGSRRRRSAPAPTNSSRSRPGVELVLEAFDQYWRKTPSVKRLVFKVIPDESTRLAALKRGEVDIVYSIRGELAEELRSTPGLTLKPVVSPAHLLALFRRSVGPEIALA